MRVFWGLLACSLSFFLANSQETAARFDNPTANLSTLWVNNPLLRNANYTNGLVVRPILLFNRDFGSRYACGFYKNGTGYMFGVFMVEVNSGSRITSANVLPQLVWAANRNRLVGENSTLELNAAGNLVLKDEKNVEVWSTNTTGKGVTSMEMQGTGNLVLSTASNGSVWQSFDHPTDVLVLGQPLKSGMKLTSGLSEDDPGEGSYFLQVEGIRLSARAFPSQIYWERAANKDASGDTVPYIVFTNGSILFFVTSESVNSYARFGNVSDGDVNIQDVSGPQYLKLLSDGSLAVFGRSSSSDGNWGMAYSILDAKNCALPSSCGKYGICNNGDCSCASSGDPADSFTSVVPTRPSLGCKPAASLAVCNTGTVSSKQHFLEVNQVDYVALNYDISSTQVDSIEKCKEICMSNCSCKGAIYRGTSCYPLDEVYTIRNASYFMGSVRTVALLKVQNQDLVNPIESDSRKRKGSIIAAVVVPVVLVCLIFLSILLYRRKLRLRREWEELVLDATPGLPKRFSYKQLQDATKDFSKKLGQGGFGSVFLGVLPEHGDVAVKKLESANQGQKEFRTEVAIIGSIQHVNLVQLKGFCAEKQQRLLVYELIANGSLDKWLFSKQGSATLDWELRFKIAVGTARGLAYLHEECREKIIHLDIKPQNILLDENFTAKVCDFGMSKLVRRDESAVFTTMRGTPGYLAPEWLQSSITEKADVYSFGIVLLELASGMKCLDTSRADSSKHHFPSWASQRVSKGAIEEVVDEHLLEAMDDEQYGDQISRLIHIALWCIQYDPGSRPSMGTVVQMLEGLLEVPDAAAAVEVPVENENEHESSSMEWTEESVYDRYNR